MSLISYSQQRADPDIAYQVLISKWSYSTENYEDVTTMDCDIAIFWLKDRIRIKDANNSVYYIRGDGYNAVTGELHVTKWNCYDESGDDCTAELIYNSNTAILVITYEHKIRYAYFLKIKTNTG